jgi:small conductance mechanosensitive channel
MYQCGPTHASCKIGEVGILTRIRSAPGNVQRGLHAAQRCRYHQTEINDKLNQIPDVLTGLVASSGMNVLGAIVTLIAGFIAAGSLVGLVNRAMRGSDKIDAVFQPLPGKIVRIAIMLFTMIAVLNRFGVQTTSLIAIGLAMQGTLSNVAAGVMILVFRPFKIGDAVNLSGDVCIIDSLGFFICKAHLHDGPIAFLPNSRIWGATTINRSVTDKDIRRIDEHYGIAHGDGIGLDTGILKKIPADEPRILADPEPLIKVDQLGDSSVNILFRV